MKKVLTATCLLFCLAAWAGAAENEALPVNSGSEPAAPAGQGQGPLNPAAKNHSPETFPPQLQYQALGRSFILPLVAETDLAVMDGQEPNNPGWQLLASAWNQARLLPYEVMTFGAEGEVGIYLAVMGSQANGRSIISPVENRTEFIASQFWAEYNSSFDISSLEPNRIAGLGVFARNDDSIYALSIQRAAPTALPADSAEQAAEGQDEARQAHPLRAMMVSSTSVVNGIPVVLGVSTNAPAAVSADQLFNLCNNITLYLALSNHLPENGFFNPDLASLVIAGRRLKLSLPPGSCLLNASTPRQAISLIQWESFHAPTHNLIAAYAPCDKLAQWRDGPESAPLAHYGLLAVNLHNGQLQLVDDAREFARNLRREQRGEALRAAKLDGMDWTATLWEMRVGAIEVLGHLGMVRNVAYWPVALRVAGADSQASGVLAGVLGVGTVNGLAVTSAVYMPIEQDKVYSTLLERQKAMFASFK